MAGRIRLRMAARIRMPRATLTARRRRARRIILCITRRRMSLLRSIALSSPMYDDLQGKSIDY